MSKFYIGIDQSKRSTGLVALDSNGGVIDFVLACSEETDNLQLLSYQCELVCAWINALSRNTGKSYGGGLIEGISFGSVGSGKDFLAGLQWSLRLTTMWKGFPLGTIPVSMWRSPLLSVAARKEAKAAGANGLKQAVYDKVPEDVRRLFEQYVARHKFKRKSLWDLSDAYWIAQHCRKLFTKE